MLKNQHLNQSQYQEIKKSENHDQVLGVDGKYQWPIRIFTPVFFVASLLFVQLAGTNGNKQTSAKFSLWVTPPGLFFSIWGLIYTGVVLVNIYNLVKNVWNLKAHIYFAITNLTSILWTFLFDMGTLASVVLASVAIIGITVSLFFTWLEMGKIPIENYNIYTYIMRNIWALYLGWCIAATNLNIGMDIVYWWGASKQTQMIIFWIVTPLCAIGAFTFNFIKYGKIGALSCFCLWISVAWAFTGAAIRTNQCIHGDC